MKPLILLDPGHGKPDSGAVLTVGRMLVTTEAVQNLAIAKTLKFLLEAEGYRVVLTRTGNDQPGGERMARNFSFMRRCDVEKIGCDIPAAYISVHHDIAQVTRWNKNGGAYYLPGNFASRTFAERLTDLTRGWCQPDTAARQGSLYVVRNSPCERGILWEVGPLRLHTKQSRLAACAPMVQTIKKLVPLA